MKPAQRKWLILMATVAVACGLQLGGQGPAVAAEPTAARVLIVAGPSTHPPGTHECAAGARVLQYLLQHAQGVPAIETEVVDAWPETRQSLQGVASVVFTGDLFPGETLENSAAVMRDLAAMMDRGCGIVCVHYATGLRAQHVSADGDHPLLRWTGGYFATGCEHHRSVARVCPATLSPEPVDHPVLRGWQAFQMDDEPYWNNYFGPRGPAENVTPLVSAMLPPEEPQKEIVAWAVQRPDGGRGMGIVVPHFYRNWRIDDLRTLVLNGICWTAQLELPAAGVQSPQPDLAAFEPASVDPQPR
jgi:type 1 glutamine amidotransferase